MFCLTNSFCNQKKSVKLNTNVRINMSTFLSIVMGPPPIRVMCGLAVTHIAVSRSKLNKKMPRKKILQEEKGAKIGRGFDGYQEVEHLLGRIG